MHAGYGNLERVEEMGEEEEMLRLFPVQSTKLYRRYKSNALAELDDAVRAAVSAAKEVSQ